MSAQEIADALNQSEYSVWEYHKDTGAPVTKEDVRTCINNKNQYLIIKYEDGRYINKF